MFSMNVKLPATLKYAEPKYHPKKDSTNMRGIEPIKVATAYFLISRRKAPARKETGDVGNTGTARRKAMLSQTFLPFPSFLLDFCTSFQLKSTKRPKRCSKGLPPK